MQPTPDIKTAELGGTPRSLRSPRRALAVLLLVASMVALLGGCARVRVALAVQPDDTVTGEIVIATPEKAPDDPGPSITVPEELESEVDVSGYGQEGYTGSLLRFSGLSFDQIGQLLPIAAAAGPAGEHTSLRLRRAGNRIVVEGSVDLTTAPADKADFRFKVSFPGEVLDTNGDADGSTVTWTFTPGEVGDVNAIVAYRDPQAPSVAAWTVALAGLVAAACAVTVLLARRTRNPRIDA